MLGKDAANLADPNPTEAAHVENYLLQNYPPAAVAWVRNATWIGPCEIPQDRVDYADADKWAASHQPGTVRKFARKIAKGTGHTNPVIAVQQDGNNKINIVDGHHRTLAYKLLSRPVKAYVGFVSADDNRWEETHASQLHSGTSPMNKSFKGDAMSRRGREYAEQMADYLIARSPNLTKSAGAREALIDRFAPEGEMVASIARTVTANEAALRERWQNANDAMAKAVTVLTRALELDRAALAKAEGYVAKGRNAGESHMVPFEPDEFKISRISQGMISRQLQKMNGHNGNGHGTQDPS